MKKPIENKKGYKRTPLGWLPEEWGILKLINLANGGISNGVFNDPKKIGKGYRLINVLDLYVEPHIDTSNLSRLNIGEKEFKRTQVKWGDIFFTRSSLKLQGIARCNVNLDRSDDLTYDGHIMKISPHQDNIYPLFLKEFCNSSPARKYFMSHAKQTTMTTIGQEDIEALPVPLPALAEQRAIMSVLSTCDATISKVQQCIIQKEIRNKWLMQQMLTGKRRLKGYGGEWKEYTYEKLFKVVKRHFDWDENKLYKLISVRRRSGGIFFREALYGHQILVKTLRTANEGDFLFSKMQILHGASALVTKEFDGAKISGSYIAVVAKEAKLFNMEFFQWYSQMPHFYHQTYISSYGVHIEKMTFDFEAFLQLEMKLPSIEEQTAIAQVLQSAANEIQILKIKTEQLQEQKKGLMQILLTGKKRLI